MLNSAVQFNINQCCVCQTTIKETGLKRCGGCFKVSYCSIPHQKSDWSTHKTFCKAIQNVEKKLPEENLSNSEDWMNYRKQLIKLLQEEMNQKLSQNEICMVFYPGRCEVCRNKNANVICLNCLGSNYCSKEHQDLDAENHSKLCDDLKFIQESLKNLVIYPPPDYSLRKGPLTLPQNMEDFIESMMEIITPDPCGRKFQTSFVSNFVSCSLSLMCGLEWINFEIKHVLTIHVVGCSDLETGLFQWEILPHIHRSIKHLNILFIGPEVKQVRKGNVCKSCRKIIKVEVNDSLYHEYVKTSSYQKPDVICAFNAGLGTCPTWKPTLQYLSQDVPFIMTSLVEHEAEKDIKLILNKYPNLVFIKNRNPFSGLKALQRGWYDELCYINKYMTVFPNKSAN